MDNSQTRQPRDFEAAKTRLEEIAAAVSDENMPLDDALDLFEEAVALGLQVSDALEDGIVVEDEPAAPEAAAENADGQGAAPAQE